MPLSVVSPLKDEVRKYPEDQRRSRKAVESRFSYHHILLRLGCKHCSRAKERWESTHVH